MLALLALAPADGHAQQPEAHVPLVERIAQLRQPSFPRLEHHEPLRSALEDGPVEMRKQMSAGLKTDSENEAHQFRRPEGFLTSDNISWNSCAWTSRTYHRIIFAQV